MGPNFLANLTLKRPLGRTPLIGFIFGQKIKVKVGTKTQPFTEQITAQSYLIYRTFSCNIENPLSVPAVWGIQTNIQTTLKPCYLITVWYSNCVKLQSNNCSKVLHQKSGSQAQKVLHSDPRCTRQLQSETAFKTAYKSASRIHAKSLAGNCIQIRSLWIGSPCPNLKKGPSIKVESFKVASTKYMQVVSSQFGANKESGITRQERPKSGSKIASSHLFFWHQQINQDSQQSSKSTRNLNSTQH